METLTVLCKINESAKDLYAHQDGKPVYATKGSAAVDLISTVNCVLDPGQQITVPTGLHMAIPRGYVGVVAPRSGLGTKGYVIANTIGVIDSDYRGEILVNLLNRTEYPLTLAKGMKFVQMLFLYSPQLNIEHADELPETERGDGGFGSTGTAVDLPPNCK